MPVPTIKVEIEFFASNIPEYTFILDDPIGGQLDTGGFLEGLAYVDVTSYLMSVSIQRGKSRLLDRYEAGTASLTFNNSDRTFDPLYQFSPIYGAVIPRLNIRISANNIIQYSGVIQDWNIEYDKGGPSFTIAVCSDRFTNLAQSVLESNYMTSEYPGARIEYILDTNEVKWSPTARDIDAGSTLLQADLIPENTSALAYLQLVETTEQGHLFIAKNGDLRFQARNYAPANFATFSDDSTGIAFSEIGVVYGTELLFNRVEINPLNEIKYTVADGFSEANFGVSTLSLTDTLHENITDAEGLADYLLTIYSFPEYRFETVSFELHKLSEADQNTLLGLEFNDVVKVIFTPSNIPPKLEVYATIIKIEHDIKVPEHKLTFTLGSASFVSFILDDEGLGVLDVNVLSY